MDLLQKYKLEGMHKEELNQKSRSFFGDYKIDDIVDDEIIPLFEDYIK